MCLLSRTKSVGTPLWWPLPLLLLLWGFKGITPPGLLFVIGEGKRYPLLLLWDTGSCCCCCCWCSYCGLGMPVSDLPPPPPPAAMLLLFDEEGDDDKMPSFRSKALVVLRVVEANAVVASLDAALFVLLPPCSPSPPATVAEAPAGD